MHPFTTVSGPAVPLMQPNIDTDVVIRVEYLSDVAREELGPYAFEALRYDENGDLRPDCVLNEPGYAGAPILIAGENFGCGSSREAAVWALAGLGIRCVIAPSFGGIFADNCFQNGVLTIRLAPEIVAKLADQAQPTGNAVFDVDLANQTVTGPDGETISFEIEALRKDALIQGLDQLGLTMQRAAEITAFQDADRDNRPWIYNGFEAQR